MADLPEHACPGCGAALGAFLRYPWYFCRACVEEVCDREGRRVVGGNTHPFGGFGWRYADEPREALRACGGVIALIRGRKVFLHEARFGGVVAEPLAESAEPDRRDTWRLDGRFPVEPTG